MKKNIILILAWLAVATSVPAQVRLALDSTSIMIGSQATLTISGTTQYPTIEDLTQGDIEALRQWFDTINGVDQQHTLFTCFEEGEHYIKVGDDSILLVVNDVANVDTASLDIKDIAGIIEEPYTFWEWISEMLENPWVKWPLIALLTLGVGGLVAWYVIKRRRANMPLIALPKAPEKTPDQRALEALELLRTRQLWQQGKAKDYHTELTDILRRFLEESYAIPSTEMTTDQTLEAFEGTEVCNDDNLGQLRRALQLADMVKFAKREPLPHEHDLSMSDAKSFVANCKESSDKIEAMKKQPKTEPNT